MRILKVEPGKAPYVKDMKDGLEAIQQEVQGLYQAPLVDLEKHMMQKLVHV